MADDHDGMQQRRIDEAVSVANERSMYARIMELNEPVWFIAVGLLGCVFAGASQPLFGIYFSRVIAFLTVPFDAIQWVYAD